MSRAVALHVVGAAGLPLGTFRCEVPTPWLQEVEDVLAVAREAGLALNVLRLLHHLPGDAAAGIPTACAYVAEALVTPPAGALAPPLPFPAGDHPLRSRYARAGGNSADIAWAASVLASRGPGGSGPPSAGSGAVLAAEQQRTWNLSCVHRLRLAGGGFAWLKAVPPFFAHEGAVIAAITALDGLAGAALHLPALLGHDAQAGRLLLAHCDGVLMWGCEVGAWRAVVDAHVDRQWRLQAAVPALRELGLPDWRGPALLAAINGLCARADVLATLTPAERSALDALLVGLPGRLAEIEACGLPDTLVHGDLHQGNVIATAEGPVLLDWGDAGVGHPLLDVPALCHGFAPADQAAVRGVVVAAWQARLPGAKVERALALIAPVMELRQALVYRTFLDGIEPAERHYHEADVPQRLRLAIAAAS